MVTYDAGLRLNLPTTNVYSRPKDFCALSTMNVRHMQIDGARACRDLCKVNQILRTFVVIFVATKPQLVGAHSSLGTVGQ
jgi:hypothetical protein